MATFKCEFPMRQAMLKVVDHSTFNPDTGGCHSYCVPVFVWPTPTQDGCFIVEHRDGSCTYAHPDDLTFLGSEELFDQYSWVEA